MSEEPKIVEAVASATGIQSKGGRNIELRRALENADVEAVNSIMAEGIPLNDSEKILERKKQYRDQVLERFRNPKI